MEFTLCQFQGSGQLKVTLRIDDTMLTARFQRDSIEDVTWPAFAGLHRADELWHSTCFELFIGHPDASSYLELNIAPDGGWNCYEFDDVRIGMAASGKLEVTNIETTDTLLEARVHWPEAGASHKWRIGLSAVIETTGSGLQYYALSHGEAPDFHTSSRHVLVRVNDL